MIATSGVYDNFINGDKHLVKQGRIILLRPNDFHYFKASDQHVFRDIYVMPDELKELCDLLSPDLFVTLSNVPMALDFTLSDFDMQILEEKMNYLTNTENKTDLQLKARHKSILLDILDKWLTLENDKKANMPQWLSLLISQLGTDKFLSKSIEEIVASTHYSHGYVCREFKRIIGKTLQEYISDAKFTLAMSLLASTENSITHVSEILGYSAPSNFIIAFKNKFNISPAQWRKDNILTKKSF
jgi:AraC-like DNA-binding protein